LRDLIIGKIFKVLQKDGHSQLRLQPRHRSLDRSAGADPVVHHLHHDLHHAPALSLRARIIALRELPAGASVGYNARFVAARPSRIGILAAGYADGLVRQRSNGDLKAGARSRVIVNSRCAPLVGTISMDLAMVDVTEVPGVELGDVVTIYGQDGCAIHANDVARELGTVTSDLLCAIGKRVPRFYLP